MARLVGCATAMNVGFGFSFYGFFVFAALWCVAYFAWAIWINKRDRG